MNYFLILTIISINYFSIMKQLIVMKSFNIIICGLEYVKTELLFQSIIISINYFSIIKQQIVMIRFNNIICGLEYIKQNLRFIFVEKIK